MPTIYSGDANPTNALSMKVIATIELAGAEISAYDPVSKKIFVTSNSGLQVIDLSNPAAPVLLSTVLFTDLGFNSNDVTSVAVRDGVVAVALVDQVKTNTGNVVFLDAEGALLGSARVGALPDMLTFTPDGSKVLVANEGEPLTDDNGLSDPVGRISIINISAGPDAATVVHAGFSAFDEQREELAAQGVRFDAGKTVSQAIEPEYIAISPDGTRAIITLQENNAFAILDLATNVITEIRPIGFKDFSNPLNAIDASDRDGGINIKDWPVKGIYMPDAIASFSANGQTYYVTANEGDAYDPFGQLGRGDAVRLKDLTLDPTAFPNADELQADANLGRLNVSSMMGDTDGDGDFDEIYTFGGRSFSIWDANGDLVFDSGNVVERATALLTPELFNANDGVASAFDGRSDDKGAEPEGITIGEVNGRTYAFLGLERAGGGVMAFDITDPANVQFAQYALNPGDISPEGLTFIKGEVSPTGGDLLAVTNEVSNTLTIYEVEESVTEPFKLQLLHFSDAEAGLLADDTAPILGALIDRFDDEYANTLVLSGGDNFIPGPFMAAGTDPSLNAISAIGATAWGRPDVAILNQMGVEVSAIGNHEWDLGSAVYADAIRPAGAWVGAQYATVSANLDFSADSAINPRTTAAGQEASSIKGLIAPWVTVTEGGEKIGILGATTQILERISSPTGTEVNGFPKAGEAGDGTVEADDMALLASQLQPIIDEMIASGIDKIVLTTHLQNLENEKLLATLLKGVDIILAAGSHTRLGDANDVAAEFPGHSADFADGYPLITAGVDGNPTLIVNTDGEYTYLGRLVVEFDENGVIDISKLDDTVNGAYASTQDVLAAVYGEDIAEAFAPDSIGAKVTEITEAVDAVISEKDGNIFGYSDVYLEGERSFVRGQETNLGNLAADAQLAALVDALGDEAETTFVASMKNGGGIRAQIGTLVDTPDGPVKVPTQGNPDAGKAPGAISQLDVENSLRFNNGLMAVDVSSADLLVILEYGVDGTPPTNQGRFPQIGGVSFSWDPTKPVGQRVSDVALIDENGVVVAKIADNGQLLAGAPEVITVVTLNFMANGGDGYPFKTLGENFRFLLDDGTLSAPVDPSLNFTDAAVVPANMLKEQQNFQEYMASNHGTPETAFKTADTAETGDTRIQNVTVREDTVLIGELPPEVPGELFEGTNRGDLLLGTDGDDTMLGLGGGDTIRGADGDDEIDGGYGNDRLYGDAGSDRIVGDSGNDLVYGGVGDDEVDAGSGSDRVYGGDGDDIIDGGDGKDVLFGEAGDDTLSGGDWKDFIDGGAGDDFIEGGDGTDQLFGGAGDDLILADTSNDYVEGGEGDDTIEAGSGNDRVRGGDGDDVIDGGTGSDRLLGDAGDDWITGGDGNDTIEGGIGADTIEAGSGNDRAYGGAGDDSIEGGAGNDNVYGGAGDDILTGDAGRDVFYFESGFGNDVITDFENGADRIDMRHVSHLNRFSDLVITQDGQDVVIAFGDNTITLLDVTVNEIDRHDIIV